jgi:hypothetical protein
LDYDSAGRARLVGEVGHHGAISTCRPAAARKGPSGPVLFHGLQPPVDSASLCSVSLRLGCGFYPIRLGGCADSLRAGSILLRRIDVGGWGCRGRREKQTRGPLALLGMTR